MSLFLSSFHQTKIFSVNGVFLGKEMTYCKLPTLLVLQDALHTVARLILFRYAINDTALGVYFLNKTKTVT